MVEDGLGALTLELVWANIKNVFARFAQKIILKP